MKPSNWEPSDGITLEPNASTAVRVLNGNTAIAAGPGAGKTELLAQRANFLFETGSCPHPRRIIAISFKVDAASNLRDRVAARCGPRASRRFDSYTFHAFARTIIARHRAIVAEDVPENFTVGPYATSTQLAYSDLLPLALRILDEDPRAVGILRQSYDFVFLDEFQDCTTQQFQLIDRAFAESDVRITAVGDSKQSIMGWAGALPDAMGQYLSTFAAIELPIYQNHRSLNRLRRVQNSVIRIMDPGAALPAMELASSTPEELATDGTVQVLGYAHSSLEARGLAELIIDDIRQGTPPSQIAVLVRQQPALFGEELIQLLADRGIAVRDEQLAQDALGEPVGRLLIDMARLLIVGRAPDEFVRVGELMTLYCVDENQAGRRRRRFEQFLRDSRQAIDTGVIDPAEPTMLEETLFEFLKICERQFLSRLSVEYVDDLVLTETARAAIAVINDAIAQSDTPEAGMSRLSQDEAVRLLTVHKSKGLEFDHVYFMAIETETFFGAPEEARSTYFVGISRARSKLVLTYSQHRVLMSAPPHYWNPNRTGHPEFLAYAAAEQ